MKYEIKQLNDTDAVVISDEEIKENNYYISWETDYATEPKERFVLYVLVTKTNGKNPKKVIATIAPFRIDGLPMLELLNQEEDIEKLADLSNGYLIYAKDTKAPIFKEGFIAGYKAAQKQYSLEDMKKAIVFGVENAPTIETHTKMISNKDYRYFVLEELINKYVQSLSTQQFPIAVELTEDLQIIKYYYE